MKPEDLEMAKNGALDLNFEKKSKAPIKLNSRSEVLLRSIRPKKYAAKRTMPKPTFEQILARDK